MRAQQHAGRRSAQTLQDRQECVNSNGQLPGDGAFEPDWAPADNVDLHRPRFKRLFVAISTVGAPRDRSALVEPRAARVDPAGLG